MHPGAREALNYGGASPILQCRLQAPGRANTRTELKDFHTGRARLMNPLNSVRGAITTGVVIALIVMFLIAPTGFHELGLARWLHILSGVMWIGLLWYFNVVQIPALGVAAADKGGPGGAGIAKYVAPRALFWFRWAALATWLTGAWYLLRAGNFVGAFTLGGRLRPVQLLPAHHRPRRLAGHDHAVQRLGADLAQPEEGARHRACERRGEGRGAQDRDAWPRASTSCCRSRCCSAWAPRRTACPSRHSAQSQISERFIWL